MFLRTIEYQLALVATICRRSTAIKTVSALRSKVPTRHCFEVQKKLLIKLTKKTCRQLLNDVHVCAELAIYESYETKHRHLIFGLLPSF